MKKIFTILGVAAATIVTAQTQVVNETFSFTGPLNANGWATHSGTPGQVVSNGSVASIIAGNTEDVNIAFTSDFTILPGQLNTIKYTATVNVLNSNGLTTTGDYFMSLATASGTTGVTVLPARLYVKAGAAGYLLGVLNASGGILTPTYIATELPYGSDQNITVIFTVVDGSMQIASLNVGSQTVTNNTGTGAAPTVLKSVVIRQGGTAASGTGNINIDNIVVTVSPILAVSDNVKSKISLVKNTNVNNTIIFGAKANVQIVNANGQVVKTAAVSENTSLDVSSLAKGIYIVTGEVNGQKVSQKVIKN